MTRFEFYTDLHLSGKTPRHRIDDFPQTMVGKLREVYSIAKQTGCDFLAFGGDFFNNHRIFSYEVIDDAMDIICADSDLITYSCIGEHDLYGHSPNTYPSSTLAHMVRRCGKFRIIRDPIEVGDVVLHAKHEWEDMFEAMKRDVDPSKYNILVCHELITNERAPFDVISTSELNPCPFDLVVSGDLHNGFEPHEVGDTWFCNPGALARRSTDHAYRWPQVAVIEVEKGLPPVIDIRRLECALPGDEVLEESIAEVARKRDGSEIDGEAFAEEMERFESESVDVHDLIQKVGHTRGVSEPALKYLASKRKDTGKEAA